MTELKNAIKQAVAKQKEQLGQETSVEIEKGRIVIDLGVELSDEEKETVKEFVREGVERAAEWIIRMRKK